MSELEQQSQRLQQELFEARRQLSEARREAERCRADRRHFESEMDRVKADFINAASHELRTPLSLIMAYAEFLEDNLAGALSGPQTDYLSQIQLGARRLQYLIDNLLEFASLESGTFELDPQPTDLAELARVQIEDHGLKARAAGIALALCVDEAPLVAMVDPTRIAQVLDHLVANALKFTPPGGRVEVRLSRLDDTARIEVADTGVGIPPEHLTNLFHTFYQVEPSLTRTHGGAGLGLSICRAIVVAHGGTIGVHSQEGRGSTFWVSLPLQLRSTPDPLRA